MDLGITNRLALVTGSSRGIGRSIAIELASQGANVILVARSSEGLEEVRSVMSEPEKHCTLAIDLMSDGGIQQLAEAVTKLGDLDIMIHNLGGSAGVFNAFSSAEEWKRVWQFNVGIGLELNRTFIPAMVERRWGRIVHLSTLAATNCRGYAPYASAKCALNGYVKSVSREVSKDNVIMSAVAPGAIFIEGRYFAKIQKEDPAAIEDYFKNNLPIRRLGAPEEVAKIVAYLCSEHAAFMAGAIVPVDGGGY